MSEKYTSPLRNPHFSRAAAVALGSALVGLAFIRSGPATASEQNFSSDLTQQAAVHGQDVRITPQPCDERSTAVGIEISDKPVNSYLGLSASAEGMIVSNAVHIEGDMRELTVTPFEGSPRVVFADKIGPDEVMKFPIDGTEMIFEIGMGPDAGAGQRMMAVVGCDQKAIGDQHFFWDSRIVNVPPVTVVAQ